MVHIRETSLKTTAWILIKVRQEADESEAVCGVQLAQESGAVAAEMTWT